MVMTAAMMGLLELGQRLLGAAQIIVLQGLRDLPEVGAALRGVVLVGGGRQVYGIEG